MCLRLLFWCAVLPAAVLLDGAEGGEDWPTWRYDSARSGATPHPLPDRLDLQWQRNLGAPDPAFDYHFRLCADASYEPVAAGGRLFVPSNVTDSVTAYDTATGAQQWQFFAEAPVRFAPVTDGNRVWFASDDGFLYCIAADTGALLWKTRGAPDDRDDHRMLINGRLCSRWPARGGPVLDGGTIYFGCGVWPSEGVFVLAVDAQTGAVRWREDRISQIDNGLEEHGKLADIGLPPHGYLALFGGKLAMPSGRAIAAFLDPQTGRLDPYNSFYGKSSQTPRGAWAIGGNNDFWFQGGSLYGTKPDVLETLPAGPLEIDDFAALCGQPLAWAEDLIAKKIVRMRVEDGRRVVLFDPRAPAIAAFPSARFGLAPNQAAQVAARPIAHTPGADSRHEIADIDLPVFAGRWMFRSEYRAAKDSVIERGDTRIRPPAYARICAYDLDEASWQIDVASGRKGDSLQRRLAFAKRWELDAALTVRMVAGGRLFAAGPGRIAAISIPAGEQPPQITWEAEVDGYPIGVIAAHQRLIVTTDKGMLYGFGGEERTMPAAIAGNEVRKPAATPWTARVKDLLERTQTAKGNALVLGWNTGALVEALTAESTMQVTVIESNAAIAATARTELAKAGVIGGRVQIITPAAQPPLRLPPFFADIVASESIHGEGGEARRSITMAVDSLRPFHGIGWLPLRPKLRQLAEAHAESSGGGFSFEPQSGQWVRITRQAAPTGSDDWTHEAASAANTFASADTRAVPPFALLWFSGGIDRFFTPPFEYQHNRNPYPVICHGRMFLLAARAVHAIDAYTGRHLWHAEIPDSTKTAARLTDHRMFSRPSDQNIIATADKVYVFGDHDAHAFDARTGALALTLNIPAAGGTADDEARWDETRILGDLLIIAAGNRLMALDRHTGAVRWQRTGTLDRVAFAIGGGDVFAIDYGLPRAAEPKAADAFSTQLVALDAADGRVKRQAPLIAAGRPEQTGSLGKNTWSGVFVDNPLKPVLACNAAHRVIVAVIDRHQYFAFDADESRPLWQKTMPSDLGALVRFEPPAVTRDFLIVDSQDIFDIRTGEPAGIGQVGGRGTGCNRVVGSDALMTFRSALACVLDLDTGNRTYLSSTRSGCTNGMIPAGGLLNSPNFAHGCVCNYPFLTSFALMHLPEAARWAPAEPPDVQFQRNPNVE